MNDYSLNNLTTNDFGALIKSGKPVVILLPVGSVEPHGPHLSLLTDTIISEASAKRAARRLEEQGLTPLIAPAVPYGVTDCAVGFKGAVSISAPALSAYLQAVAEGFLVNGVAHVCLINNHLEPDHDAAVRTVAAQLPPGRVSVACPLTRRWARTLPDEFKRGECHAGRYETSIVLAAQPGSVKQGVRNSLPEVPISLSDKLQAGVGDFKGMGMSQAYAGAPALATAEEGEEILDKLTAMICTEILETLELDKS